MESGVYIYQEDDIMLSRIQENMRQALKAGEKKRLSTIRMLLASVKNEAIEKRRELDETEIVAVVQREIKQRRNAIEEFAKGKRDDLVTEAKEEIAFLEAYLPRQLSDEELEKLVRGVVDELKATAKEFGKVMGKLMPQVKGKAEGDRVQAMVKKILG
jgi:uncharacterized protein YqeY